MEKSVEAGLAAGVKELVIWLNGCGYVTCDSGDGSNYENGMEGACPFPMIVIKSTPTRMVQEAERLHNDLRLRGVPFYKHGVNIETSYSPVDGLALISIIGVLSSDVDFGDMDRLEFY